MHKAPTLRFSLIKLRIFSRPNYKYSILSINMRSCRCMNKCVRRTFKKKRRSDDDAGEGLEPLIRPRFTCFGSQRIKLWVYLYHKYKTNADYRNLEKIQWTKKSKFRGLCFRKHLNLIHFIQLSLTTLRRFSIQLTILSMSWTDYFTLSSCEAHHLHR